MYCTLRNYVMWHGGFEKKEEKKRDADRSNLKKKKNTYYIHTYSQQCGKGLPNERKSKSGKGLKGGGIFY